MPATAFEHQDQMDSRRPFVPLQSRHQPNLSPGFRQQIHTLMPEMSVRPVQRSRTGVSGALMSKDNTTMPDVHSTICTRATSFSLACSAKTSPQHEESSIPPTGD